MVQLGVARSAPPGGKKNRGATTSGCKLFINSRAYRFGDLRPGSKKLWVYRRSCMISGTKRKMSKGSCKIRGVLHSFWGPHSLKTHNVTELAHY